MRAGLEVRALCGLVRVSAGRIGTWSLVRVSAGRIGTWSLVRVSAGKCGWACVA